MIAFPVLLLVLLLVFRSVAAMLVPLLMAGSALAISSGIGYLVARATDLSILYSNIISMIGLSMLWPPAVVLAFLGAIAFVGVLIASVNRGGVGRLPAGLRPPQQARPVERTYQHAGQHRRAG